MQIVLEKALWESTPKGPLEARVLVPRVFSQLTANKAGSLHAYVTVERGNWVSFLPFILTSK